MAQKNNQKGKRVPAYTSDRMVAHLIVGLLLVALGVMIFLANALGMTGDVFDSLRQVSRGLCGVIAIALPVIPIWGGVLLMIGILLVCTAYLVDGSFSPFLYFRF